MSVKEIIARIKEEGEKEIQKVREYYESRVKEIQKKQDDEQKKFYDVEMEKIDKDKAEIKRGILLSAKLEQRKIILKAKRDMINKVFDKVKNDFQNIVGKEKYYKFLNDKISKIVDDGDIVYLCSSDVKEFGAKLKKDLKKKVEIKESNIFAGFLVEKKDFNYNSTIEALLASKIEEFEKMVGTKLNVL